MMPIYQYTDYRRLLKDLFSELKRRNPRFSYRVFNRLAGIKSSSFLKLVMEGKRNLAEEGIAKVIRGFRLVEAEARHFELLVRFNQAKTEVEKDVYSLGLNRSRDAETGDRHPDQQKTMTGNEIRRK